MESKAYMYVLECADGSLYTGYTTNVDKRIQTHNAGKGAKYTRNRLPVSLLYRRPLPASQKPCRLKPSLKNEAGRAN